MTFSDISLIPIGETPLAPVRDVAEDLARISGLSTRMSANRVSIPEDSYDVRRGQFQAPRLLQVLRGLRPASDGWIRHGDSLVLGIAAIDLYAPGLSFVFGQADTAAGVAVISLARLYPAFYGRNHVLETFRRRAAIEAVHEVGHLLGVHHCDDRHCVMFYSSTITDSDRKGPTFCVACRTMAGRSVAGATAASPTQPSAAS